MTLPASALRRGAQVVPLLSSGCFVALMYTAVSPVLAGMAAARGNDGDATLLVQLFMTSPSLGMVAGGLLSAWLVGRWGSRTLLLAALSLYGVAGVAAAFVDPAAALLATRVLLGVAAAGVATGATTLMGERFEPATRGRLIGYQSSAGAAAGLLSTLLAGLLAEAAGWRAPFGFYAAAWAVALLAAWSLAPSATERIDTQTVIPALPWRSLLPLYALCVPLYAAIFMTTTQVPFLLRDDGYVAPATQAGVLAMASTFNAVGSALYGRVAAAMGGRRAFALALAAMGLGQLVLGSAHEPWRMALGCATAGFGAGLAVPHVPTLLMQRAGGAARGRALGVMYTFMFIGSFCNPLLVAPLSALAGRHGALLVTGLALATGSLVALWQTRQLLEGAGP